MRILLTTMAVFMMATAAAAEVPKVGQQVKAKAANKKLTPMTGELVQLDEDVRLGEFIFGQVDVEVPEGEVDGFVEGLGEAFEERSPPVEVIPEKPDPKKPAASPPSLSATITVVIIRVKVWVMVKAKARKRKCKPCCRPCPPRPCGTPITALPTHNGTSNVPLVRQPVNPYFSQIRYTINSNNMTVMACGCKKKCCH